MPPPSPLRAEEAILRGPEHNEVGLENVLQAALNEQRRWLDAQEMVWRENEFHRIEMLVEREAQEARERAKG